MNSKEEKSCTNNTVINISSVGKFFASKPVLKDINVSIMRGQSVCLCGINGAGKSTLFRIITGLLQPDRGSVKINGYDVSREPEKSKACLGVISHKSMVYSELTVLENILFFATLYGVEDGGARANELLKDVGLFSYRYDKAGILSRGLLQRLAIVRALIHEPVLLLADEPFTGLDSEASRHLISVLNNFNENGGTVVMTTHDIRIGLQCCERVLVLDGTKLIFDALKSEIDITRFSQDYLAYARAEV